MLYNVKTDKKIYNKNDNFGVKVKMNSTKWCQMYLLTIQCIERKEQKHKIQRWSFR